ncbi:hypothetical protein [Kytococcus sedentarius]|uniref:hypothetical protein n=1 Tax=Kytococcus sedentarius TaxID=1276 RepID=UPI0035BC7BAB
MPRVLPRAATAALTLCLLPALGATAHAEGDAPDAGPVGVEFSVDPVRDDGSQPWTLHLSGEAGDVTRGGSQVQWDLTAYDHDEGAITTLAYDGGLELACIEGPLTPVDATFTDRNATERGHEVLDPLTPATDEVSVFLQWCDSSGEPMYDIRSFERVTGPDGTDSFVPVTDTPSDGESEAPEDPHAPEVTSEELMLPAEIVAFWQEMAPDMGSQWQWLLDLPPAPDGLTDADDPAWAAWIAAQVEQGTAPADLAWILRPDDLPPAWAWLEELDGQWDQQRAEAHVDGLVAEGTLPASSRLAAVQLLLWSAHLDGGTVTDETAEDTASGPVVEAGVSTGVQPWWLVLAGGGLLAAGAGTVAVARRRA